MTPAPTSTSATDIGEYQPGKTWKVLNEEEEFNVTLPLGFGESNEN